jgi:Domain of Unknown Function (DUF1206)
MTTMRATRQTVRHAATGTASHALARAGLVARGVIYLLIGWVALMLAMGKSNQEADQRGALQILASKPHGSLLLWLVAAGFAAYALWRLSEAAFGVTGERPGAGPRIKSLARGVIYAFFAVMTVGVIKGSEGSQTQKQQDYTAKIMRHSGGRWAIGIVGAIVLVVGLMLVVEGLQRKFEKLLRTDEMSARTHRVVRMLGTIGTIARGVVFAVAGVLVIDAAKTYNASKSHGLDGALRTLRDRAFGPYLLGAAAIGLMMFGLYGLCEARWRKV